MYNNPFYMPGYTRAFISPNIARGLSTRALANTASSSNGLLSRILPGLSGIRKINWGNLINNTSRTLGLINQTIPIVKQVGPVVNNMKSMVRVASLFKDETDIKRPNNNQRNYNNQQNTNNNQNFNNYQPQSSKEKTQYNNYRNQEDDSSPTFFINT